MKSGNGIFEVTIFTLCRSRTAPCGYGCAYLSSRLRDDVSYKNRDTTYRVRYPLILLVAEAGVEPATFGL
jgi:hypothetical protein